MRHVHDRFAGDVLNIDSYTTLDTQPPIDTWILGPSTYQYFNIISMSMYLYIYMYTYLYVYIHIYTLVAPLTLVYIHIYTLYIYVYIHIHTCSYECIYIYTLVAPLTLIHLPSIPIHPSHHQSPSFHLSIHLSVLYTHLDRYPSLSHTWIGRARAEAFFHHLPFGS